MREKCRHQRGYCTIADLSPPYTGKGKRFLHAFPWFSPFWADFPQLLTFYADFLRRCLCRQAGAPSGTSKNMTGFEGRVSEWSAGSIVAANSVSIDLTASGRPHSLRCSSSPKTSTTRRFACGSLCARARPQAGNSVRRAPIKQPLLSVTGKRGFCCIAGVGYGIIIPINLFWP